MMGYCEAAVADLLARLSAALAGRYTIERELGRGGMAHVFLAHDLRHDRSVALKVLRPELAAALGPERFLREIALAAPLAHPHILALLDSGDADGLLYYVMPHVEGESLRARLDRESQLPLDDTLRIGQEVAGALDYAHRHQVVHRDIKPENILFQDGLAVVADFGIARALIGAGTRPLTQSGLTVGTPSYMSPEQAAGDAQVDGRSDVYSLGCVLYEMLAGEPPYTGATAQAIIAKRFSEPVPHIRTLRDVPEPVERAITRALARVPADRFATAADFAAALVSAPAMPPARTAPPQSIAVLPFTNLSPDPENEYFSDGMTEEVINALAQLGDLHVAARTSSFAFKGKRGDLRTIGDRLGVRTLLEGSVRRAGDRLRVTAQLTNAADGYQLWSERYDRGMDDIFAVQDEIARAIVARLRVTLARPEAPLVRPGTDDLEAYDLYLKGRYFWARRGEGLQKAIDCFERAIAADPGFAAPYAGLADTYCILGVYGYMPSTTVQERTRDAAERALALDDRLAEAHYSVGFYEWTFGWDLERAERHSYAVPGAPGRSACTRPARATARPPLPPGERADGSGPLLRRFVRRRPRGGGTRRRARAHVSSLLLVTRLGSRPTRGVRCGAQRARASGGVLGPELSPGEHVGDRLRAGRSRGRRPAVGRGARGTRRGTYLRGPHPLGSRGGAAGLGAPGTRICPAERGGMDARHRARSRIPAGWRRSALAGAAGAKWTGQSRCGPSGATLEPLVPATVPPVPRHCPA